MSKRAPKGEGSIFLRGDGRWQAQVFYRDEFERPQRRYVYGDSYRDAFAKSEAIRNELKHGIPPADEHLTLGAWLEEWLSEVQYRVRPTTHRSYVSYVRNHLMPELGGIGLRQLTARHIELLQRGKLERGLSPATVEMIRRILRNALGDAERHDLVIRNVAKHVGRKTGPRFEPTVLSAEDARKLLAALSEDRLGALYVLALTMGLWSGELRGLQWSNVDMEQGCLHVRRTLQRDREKKLVLGDTKTERSRRDLPIPELALEALKQHRERQSLLREIAGARWVESDFVFTTTIGTPLDSSNLSNRFKERLKSIGFPPMRLHDLRHSCATLLLSQGVELRVIMEQLGHSSIVLTANTYGHVQTGLKRQVAERMDDLFCD